MEIIHDFAIRRLDKSNAQKCQNPYFDQVSESTQPLLQIYPLFFNIGEMF